MDKEIEEMTKVICGYQIFPNGDTAICECSGLPCDYECEEEDIAEDLYNAGYRKAVWHKVADGDLPKDKQIVLIAWKNVNGEIITDIDRFMGDRFLDVRIVDVIAWTELPKYEEKK